LTARFLGAGSGGGKVFAMALVVAAAISSTTEAHSVSTMPCCLNFLIARRTHPSCCRLSRKPRPALLIASAMLQSVVTACIATTSMSCAMVCFASPTNPSSRSRLPALARPLRRGAWRGTAALRNQPAQLNNGEEADLLALYTDGQHPNEGSERYLWQQRVSAARAVAIRACTRGGVSSSPRTWRWHAVVAAAAIRPPLEPYDGSLEPPRPARAAWPSGDSNHANARPP
jgi:hypothetical protein